jgi:hypothetical protein
LIPSCVENSGSWAGNGEQANIHAYKHIDKKRAKKCMLEENDVRGSYA